MEFRAVLSTILLFLTLFSKYNMIETYTDKTIYIDRGRVLTEMY